MAAALDLTHTRHESRVLGAWLASREGGAERAGVCTPRAENAISTNLTAEELVQLYSFGSLSSAGVPVTPEGAQCVPTVYACVDRIAGAIKSMPFLVHERKSQDSQPVDHDYNWLFNERACEDWSAADAWGYLVANKLLYGDGYAELLRPSVSSNRVIGWRPLFKPNVHPFRDRATGTKYYRVTRADGSIAVLDQADVIQLPSMGYDGLQSPSPITYAAREVVGAALAGQRWSGKFFSEGAAFDYALKTDQGLDDAQIKGLKAQLVARVAGSRAPLILTGGLSPAQLTVNPKDAELLASRIFTVEEICRIFGVPPHLVGHTEKNSSWGTGMEQQGTNFVRYTLLPHLTQIAQEFNHKLWPTRARFFVKHVPDSLVQADVKTRHEAHRSALGRAGEPGWMTVNEVRRKENLAPVDDGDTLNPGTPKGGEGANDAKPTDPAAS